MAEAPLAVEGLSRAFGGIRALSGVSLRLAAGELHALIGPNGAGKTTLVDLVTGELRPDAGRVLLQGEDVTRLPVDARARRGLGRTFQLTRVLPSFNALENVVLSLLARPGAPGGLARDPLRDPELVAAAEATLARVGLEAHTDRPAADLAHGQKRRLELAMVLALDPPVLLLDEPLAGLGAEESASLVELLRGLKGGHAILLVEHDMDAVFALADRVSVLVQGRLVASGSPPEVRGHAEVRSAYLGEDG